MTLIKIPRPNSKYSTTLAGAVTDNVSTTFSVNAVPSRVPCILLIDPGTTKQEKVKCTAKGVSTITVVRNFDGAHVDTHDLGASVVDYNSPEYLLAIADVLDANFNDDNTPSAASFVTPDGSTTLTNKTLTSPVLNTGVSGTAIDTDGTLAGNSDTKLASQKAVKTYVDASAGGGNTDGWNTSSDTWVYASASTFTIAGVDRTGIYTKGTRLRFKQGGGYKYAVVYSSAFSTNTTVTIAINSDYTIANSSITNNYYSYQVSPQGYPTWFNFSTTLTTSGSAFTNAPTINKAIYAIEGSKATIKINFRFNATSGGTGNVLASLPAALNPISVGGGGWGNRPSDNKVLGVQVDTTPQLTITLYDANTCIANNNLCDVGAIYQI